MNKRFIIAGLTVLFAWGTAQAAVIGIDLSGNASRGPIADSLPGVVGKTSDVTWNRVNDKNLYSSLQDEDDVTTGASFQITGAGAVYFASTDVVSGNDFFETYANLSGSGDPGLAYTNSFTISGLANAADLYFYSTWHWADAGAEFRVSGDAGATWSEWKLADGVPSVENAGFTNGQSYVVFTNITAHTDGTILGEWATTTNGNSEVNRGIFNAVQIVGDVEAVEAAAFTTNSFTKPSVQVQNVYSDSIADMATGYDLTFTNLSTAGWLEVASNGTLSGTPTSDDVGTNSFSLMVTDGFGNTDTATMTIVVEPLELLNSYVDTFDGDGIDVNTGEGGGLILQTWDVNYLDVTDTNTALNFTTSDPAGNLGAQRSAVYSSNMFSIVNGFTLDVVYNIEVLENLSEAATFGLVDRTDSLLGAFKQAATANGLGMSLTSRSNGSTIQGLNEISYTEGDATGTLTTLSNDQTVTAGTNRTFSLTVDADGNFSYSIDGQTATSGTTDLDLSKGYYIALYSQRPTTVFSVESITFSSAKTVTEIGAIDMELSGGTTAGFTWFAEYGGDYELQVRDNLAVGGEEAWTYVTNVIGDDAEITVTDEMDDTQLFYRIKLVD